LGSSAAAIVGGIVLARALVDDGATRLDDMAVFQLAGDLEGHPDNVAATLFGGLTVAWLDGESVGVERLDSAAAVTVFVPPDAVSTEKARGLLPDQVPHRDASYNAGRAALLVVALTSAPDRLLAATDDRLHQSYRSEAMPDSYALMQALRADDVPAIISGAGPTVLAFGHGLAGRAPEGWKVLELGVDSGGARILAT
jgi:homoserine kinase